MALDKLDADQLDRIEAKLDDVLDRMTKVERIVTAFGSGGGAKMLVKLLGGG